MQRRRGGSRIELAVAPSAREAPLPALAAAARRASGVGV